MKRLFDFFKALSLLLIILSFTTDSNDAKKIADKVTSYHISQQQEKIYLHLDKPLYASGEDVWFKAYLVDASLHFPKKNGTTIYAELFNENGKLLFRRILPVKDGWAAGDFHLADSLPQGKYVVRAYTKNMKNNDPCFFFQKEIQVFNPDMINMPKSSGEDTKIDLQFFPEGGNFVAGVENGLAFKAIDQNGTGIDVEGEVQDANGNIIVNFKSMYKGMGMVRMKPLAGQEYKAVIKNKSSRFPLPGSIESGYMMRVDDRGPNLRIALANNSKTDKTEDNVIYVVAHTRGIVHYASKAIIGNNQASVIKIPKSNAPSGITHITVFDEDLVPVCERLFFINNNTFLNMSVTADKPNYKKRELVKMDISVYTPAGNPANGIFSLSVYDVKAAGTEKYPLNINSYLLLNSDLKGTVEDPGFYFKDTLPQTKLLLDLVMLTHGWRRFEWANVLEDTVHKKRFYPEKWLTIGGEVMKAFGNSPATGSQVKIATQYGDMIVAKTDPKGIFYVDSLFYYDSAKVVIQTDNAKGKQSDLKLRLYPFTPSPDLEYTPSVFINTTSSEFLNQNKHRNEVEKLKLGKGNILLKEIEVKGKKDKPKEEEKIVKPYGVADYVVNSKDFPLSSVDILNAIQGKVAGLMVSGMGSNVTVSIRGGDMPLFLVDGMPATIDLVQSINPQMVESVDILSNPGTTSIYGGRGGNGVIAIYTKRGAGFYEPSPGITKITYPGYYKAREFYVPKYNVSSTDHSNPDIRTTMYWNPDIVTDSAGKASVSFFTSDVTSSFKIVLEGISGRGITGSYENIIEVK